MNLEQVRFCAESCAHQQSGEMSVYNMARALNFAQYRLEKIYVEPITISFIKELGILVEPRKNQLGFATGPRFSPDYKEFVKPELIVKRLQYIIDAWYDDQVDAIEFYKEIAEIHPFMDGTGRVSAILFNFIKETLHAPVHPPNLWSKVL